VRPLHSRLGWPRSVQDDTAGSCAEGNSRTCETLEQLCERGRKAVCHDVPSHSCSRWCRSTPTRMG